MVTLDSIIVPIEELIELKLKQRDIIIHDLVITIENLQTERDILCKRLNDCLRLISINISKCATIDTVCSKESYNDGFALVETCLYTLAKGLDECAKTETVYTKNEIDKKFADLAMSNSKLDQINL